MLFKTTKKVLTSNQPNDAQIEWQKAKHIVVDWTDDSSFHINLTAAII